MTASRLSLQSLKIRRFLGIRRDEDALVFESGVLGPAANLVYGPNGAGKTTTARAIQGIIWPATVQAQQPTIEGTLRRGDDVWRVDIQGTRVRHWRNGEEAVLSGLPPADAAPRYLLSLHELLAAEDADLAAAIQVEINGGYDPPAAARDLGWTRRPATRKKPREEFEQARRGIDAAVEMQRALRLKEAELERLNADVAAGREAERTAAALAACIRLRQAKQALDEATTRDADYPPQVFRLRGTEADELAALEKEAREECAEAERLAAELAKTRQALAARAPAGEAVGTAVITQLRTLRADWRKCEEEVIAATGTAATAAATEAAARRSLGSEISDQQLAGLGRVQPDPAFRDLVRDLEICRAREKAAQAVKERLAAVTRPSPERLEALAAGIRELQNWLQAGGVPADPERDVVLIGILGVGTLGAFVAAFVLHMAFLAAAAVFAAAFLRVCRRRPSPSVDRAAVACDNYRRLDLEPPARWHADDVRQLADRLAAEQRDADVAGELVRLRDEAEAQLAGELAEHRRALCARGEALAQRLGAVVDLAQPTPWLQLCERLSAWQEAHEKRESAEAAQAAAARAREECRRHVQAILGTAAEAPETGAALDGVIAELDERRREVERLQAATTQQEKDREQCLDRVAKAGGRRRDLLQRVGIADDTDAALCLGSYLEQREGAVQARNALRDARTTHRIRQDEFDAQARDFPADAHDLSLAELEDAYRMAEERANRLPDDQRCVTEITTSIRDAKAQRVLEEALARRRRAADQIRDHRESAAGAVAGAACLAWIQEQGREQSSGVLDAARAAFGRITKDRYELLVDDRDGPAFAARDRVRGGVDSLATLSSGTRVQLLLAVRLAFLSSLEGDGPRLPLLFDEVLGNSDDERAGAVIASAVEATRAGRQVFYFTAQADEVGKWRAFLRQREIPFNEVCLPLSPAGDAPVALAIERPPAAVVPPPDGLDHAAYGQCLGVLPLDPRRPLQGRIHVWYLFASPAVICRLLQNGYDVWSQVAALTDRGGAAAVAAVSGADASALRRAERSAELLERLAAWWRIGRGRPVDRVVLQDSGAVSATFIDRAAAIAEGARGDAATTLAEVAALPRFQRDKAQRLETWLSVEGYLDEQPRLTHDELRHRLFSAAAPALAAGEMPHADVQALLSMAAAW